MEESLPYQRVESLRRAAKNNRLREDALFAERRDHDLASIDNERNQKLSKFVTEDLAQQKALADAEKETSDLLQLIQTKELEELLTRHKEETEARTRGAQAAIDQLADKNRADEIVLLDFYKGKRLETETRFEGAQKVLLAERATEDQKLMAEIFSVVDEQSDYTIDVAPRTATPVPDLAAQPRQQDQLKTLRRSASVAPAVHETPLRNTDDLNWLRGHSQTPQSRPRANTISSSKRFLPNSFHEDSTPPSSRRKVSDVFKFAQNIQTATVAHATSISSTSSQTTTQSAQQDTKHPIPEAKQRQILGSHSEPDDSSAQHTVEHQDIEPGTYPSSRSLTTPTKNTLLKEPASGPRTSPPVTSQSPSRASALQSSPLNTSRGKTTLSDNFEIVAVRYNYATGGGQFSWTSLPNDPPRWYRLRDGVYRPVLKQGKSTGSPEWHIISHRIWALKYDTDNCLAYIKRSQSEKLKTGNTGGDMWVVFKNQENLMGFLESYLKDGEGRKFDKTGLEDEIPLSMLGKRS